MESPLDALSDDEVAYVLDAGLSALRAREAGDTDAQDAARWRYFDTPRRWFKRDAATGQFSVGINVFVDGAFHHTETEAEGHPNLKAAIDAALIARRPLPSN